MLRIIIVIAILIAILSAVHWFLKNPPTKDNQKTRNGLITLGVVALALLAASGRLNWLVPVIGAGIAFSARLLPHLIRYAPLLQRIWQQQQTGAGQSSSRPPPPPPGNMAKQEAYRVLNLKPPVTKEEIVAAHRRLIQKVHPDRGGSDYLAAKINEAKKILIGR
ncbi:MAG: DnaJ domain-containing protein [Methylococcales bacterium]